MKKGLSLLPLFLLFAPVASLRGQEPNYDESRVPEYELPDPLALPDGQQVEDGETWRRRQRPRLLELFRTHVYGRVPSIPYETEFELLSVDGTALEGRAVRKQVRIHIRTDRGAVSTDLLIYLPGEASQPVPVFLGLNFYGNQTVHTDPGILISESWMRDNHQMGVEGNRATEASRGVRSGRWPVEMILENGFGLATAYYGDIDPDFHDGFQNGIHPLFYAEGQSAPRADEWGAIGAWAFGLSRMLDYLTTDPDVASEKVAVMGHSRLGKTSLWAGAADQRFAIVISNDSGCGGAALSRRQFGETVERITDSFPHWFCRNFDQYAGNEEELPVDQHMLIALAAPRPVYVASAAEDRWADPRGEYLSALQASPVYRLLGLEGLPAKEWPPVDEPVFGTIGYHVRSGGHDVKEFDWRQFLLFAEKHYSSP